jgi:hypothetical protein
VNGRVKPDHDKLIAIAAQAADLRLKPPYRFIPGVPSGTITAGSPNAMTGCSKFDTTGKSLPIYGNHCQAKNLS